MSALDAAALLRRAREGAALTQRELARRARTSQSVVARIENGSTSPSVRTLSRLLKAAGFGVTVDLTPGLVVNSHMLQDVARILRLTPEERLREVRNLNRFEHAARRD